MRAYLYARVSKEDMNAGTQQTLGSERIAEQGWRLAMTITDDDGETSKRREFQKRSGLAQMLNAAKDGLFEVLVVRDETRLGGDMARVSLILSELNDYGIKVWCYHAREFLQMDRAIDRFVVMARNLASELEREKAAERTCDAFRDRARRGLSTGGRLFGYVNEGREKEKRPAVDPRTLSVALDIAERFADGAGLRTLARALNDSGVPSPTGKLWSHAALYAWVTNPKIHGDGGTYNKTNQGIYRHGTQQPREDRPSTEHVPHPWPALLPPDLSARVKQRLSQVKRSGRVGGRGTGHTYLLGSQSVARCGDCGGPIWASRNKRRGTQNVKAYGCGHRHDGRAACNNDLWQYHDQVDEAVTRYLLDRVMSEGVVTEIVREVRRRFDARRADTPAKLDVCQAQARQLRSEIERATALLFAAGEGSPKAIVRGIAEREERLEAIMVQIARLEAVPTALGETLDDIEAEAHKRLSNLRRLFASDPKSARTALESLIDGPLTLTPTVVGGRRVYRVEGPLALGRLLMSEEAVPNVGDCDQSPTVSSGSVPSGTCSLRMGRIGRVSDAVRGVAGLRRAR